MGKDLDMMRATVPYAMQKVGMAGQNKERACLP